VVSIASHLTFFKTIIDRPIPLDLRILRALSRLRSSMAIDIYCWLTYRASYIRKPMKRAIPWRLIQQQMGAGIERERDFRRNFLHWLKVVRMLYPHIQVEVIESKEGRNGGGLVLNPCRSSVLPMLP
jgi:hypothetical protein